MDNRTLKGSARKPQAKRHISPQLPNIVELFRKHLDDGNSPRTFVSKLIGSDRSYAWLKANNQEFYELAERHTPKMYRRGHLNYNPAGINDHITPVKRSRLYKDACK